MYTMIKSSIFSVFFLFSLTNVFAQTLEIPTNYSLETPEDCEALHPTVVQVIDWLQDTPIDEQKDKRTLANAFFIQWLEATPYVGIELHMEFLGYVEKNPELLSIFMGGWAKFAINNPDQKADMPAGAIAGTEAVLAFVNANPGIKKRKALKKLYALQEEGELEDWISNIF